MSERFEGTWLANPDAVADDARLECGICWTVYDPAVGDPGLHVAAGTSFKALPADWHCPSCGAPKDKFMLLDSQLAAQRAATPADAIGTLRQRVAALENAFRQRDARMRDLPVYNGLLRIEAVGARVDGERGACVLISPWFMNIIVFPLDPSRPMPAAEGAKLELRFPSGDYEAIIGRIDGFGWYLAVSLFSPMFEFADQAVARITAQAAADGLYAPPEDDAPAPAHGVSRRALLTGAAAEHP